MYFNPKQIKILDNLWKAIADRIYIVSQHKVYKMNLIIPLYHYLPISTYKSTYPATRKLICNIITTYPEPQENIIADIRTSQSQIHGDKPKY